MIKLYHVSQGSSSNLYDTNGDCVASVSIGDKGVVQGLNNLTGKWTAGHIN